MTEMLTIPVAPFWTISIKIPVFKNQKPGYKGERPLPSGHLSAEAFSLKAEPER